MRVRHLSHERFAGLILCVALLCSNCSPPPSRVLIVDGQNLQGPPGPICGVSLNTAELYESSRNSFAQDGKTLDARDHFALVQMLDGRILVAGGWHVAFDNRNNCATTPLASSAIYDASGGFSAAAPMNIARGEPGGAVLPSGDVLIAGGADASQNAFNTAELYHPQTNAFATVSSVMSNHRDSPTVTPLLDGTVLIAGGRGDGQPALTSADLYDPTTQTFRPPSGPQSSMLSARYRHTATLLGDGTVLLTGGVGELASAEIYDPVAGQFVAASPMTIGRYFHTATRLQDGRVLIAGGVNYAAAGGTINPAEIYDPTTRSFAQAASLATSRAEHTATLLNDGRVLIAGGWSYRRGCAAPCYLSSTEIFDGQSFSAGPDMNALRGGHGAVNVQYEVIVGSAPNLAKYADRPSRR